MAPLPQPAAGGPGGDDAAVLPQVLRRLVQRRRAVKELLKRERDPGRRRQLDVRQQALKLTANSMYGCLGFTGSRFYAKPLAELVTLQGREILQSTVDLVQNELGLDVIYGDTDSIMINTGICSGDPVADMRAVGELGAKVKAAVNKRYKLLEIEQDGVFQSMLLLKKKKYAALKVEVRSDGSLTTVVEAKGLDIVRRDWCGLSKELGNMALGEILSGRPSDDVVAAIHAKLRETAARLAAGEVPLEAFIITKALTKRPEDYPDGKSQPHVAVALRRAAAGKRDGVAAGETVPYVICVTVPPGQGGCGGAAASSAGGAGGAASGKGLADRAAHPDEVVAGGTLAVDVPYYLSQQLHPVVSRLCAPIAGTDAAQLAEALGLDPSKFGGAVAVAGRARDDFLLGGASEEERFAHCAPLTLRRGDGSTFEFAGAGALARGAVTAADLLGGGAGLAPGQLANQVRMAANGLVSRYYDGWMRSDDELYPCVTRDVSTRRAPGCKPGTAPPDSKCTGAMRREFGEKELYDGLANLRRLTDWDAAVKRIADPAARAAADKMAAPARAALRAAYAVAARMCDASAYRYINMGSVFG
jgi:DNA polymerase alpha subunit A